MASLVFSYGTLQLASVQVAVFGREIVGEPDTVPGFVLGEVHVTDLHVIEISGADILPALVASTTPGAHVDGTVFSLDAHDLAAADAYEVDAYRRVEVLLGSGRTAWVYALAELQS